MKNTLRIVLFYFALFSWSHTYSQTPSFWDKAEKYTNEKPTASYFLDINAYTNSVSKEIHESTYAELYLSGNDLMFKLPDGIMVGNADWALQIIEAKKSVVVSKALKSTEGMAQFNFVEMLKGLVANQSGELRENEVHYILTKTGSEMGQFRKVEWYFSKRGEFGIKKAVIYFNQTRLTHNTTQGGSGEEYTLDDPRLEIVYTKKQIAPIKVEDIIKITAGEFSLINQYSGYTLIDLSTRYESSKTN